MLVVALAIANVGAGAGGAIIVVLVVSRATVINGLMAALAIVVLGWCQRPFSMGTPSIPNMLADTGVNWEG